MRLHAPLTRDGVVLPLLASCLVLALIAGTLLTVFTAGPGNGNLPGATGPGSASPRLTNRATGTTPSSPPSASPSSPAPPTTVIRPGPKLPDQTITVSGKPFHLSILRATAAVLALLPAGCLCTEALRTLAGQASAARLTVYLIGTAGQKVSAEQLARQVSAKNVLAGYDPRSVLSAYRPIGLTALLVSANGDVEVVRQLSAGASLQAQLHSLGSRVPPTAAASPRTTSPRSTAASSPAATTSAK
jgi:hypothetical protein